MSTHINKILLIEDHVDILETTTEILRLANYEVFTARNGAEGVAAALKEIPDIIICDIMMPVLDGYGVLEALLQDDSTMNIPFIFLTAKAERSDFRKGMELGADDYLTKPFDDDELLAAISARIKKQEFRLQEFSNDVSGFNQLIHHAKGLDSMKMLSDVNTIKHYEAKASIYHEGSYPKSIYFIKKGQVKTYQENEAGKELVTGLFKAGDFFGYLPILQEKVYSGSACALTEVELLQIPKEDFLSLIYKNADVSKKFINMLSNHLVENEKQLLDLAYSTVRKRVAESLLKLHDIYKKEGQPKFSFQIPREDLASMAGTSVETTIRTLSEFKKEKLIETSGSSLSIVDLHQLGFIAN